MRKLQGWLILVSLNQIDASFMSHFEYAIARMNASQPHTGRQRVLKGVVLQAALSCTRPHSAFAPMLNAG